MATLTQISNLSKSYLKQEIFSSANVVISENQKIGVTSHNGAGKSTLLKMIAGDETPDTGIIDIHDITHLGYLEQHDKADHALSVLNFLEQSTGKESWQCAKVAARLLKEPNLF